MNFVLVPYINSPKIFLLVLKLNLFVAKLFSKPFFLFIQVQEDLYIAIQFSLLFIFDDLFNLSLLDHILSPVLLEHPIFFLDFLFHLRLQLSKLLSLFSNMFMHSELHLVEILLIDFPSLPKSEAILSL